MTVVRQNSEKFDTSPEHLLDCLLTILKTGQQKYSYVDAEVDRDSGKIHTRIRPNLWPLLLSTRLDIQIQGGDMTSNVIVRTRSQWFILGDVFNFYRSYIKDLLNSLRFEVERNVEQRGSDLGSNHDNYLI